MSEKKPKYPPGWDKLTLEQREELLQWLNDVLKPVAIAVRKAILGFLDFLESLEKEVRCT